MEKIVVGIDGSEASTEAFRWAVSEARAHHAGLVAVHAWEAPQPTSDLTPDSRLDVVEFVTDAYEAALQLVSSIVDDVVGDDGSLEVSVVAIEGPAPAALIDASADADLLVVGSRGQGGLAELLLGSVSHEVASHAPCPVVIHRARAA